MPIEKGKFLPCWECSDTPKKRVQCVSCEHNKHTIERLNRDIKAHNSVEGEIGKLNKILEKTSRWLISHGLQDVVRAYRDESHKHTGPS